ncbi:hypothetical protein [Corynebacterium kalidii]|uniref:Uncharacterized protein n=1 Tax=Corynebacterium kalidii TaxID=2931982 RepID=A0A9X2B1C0_9CORY|nr:hypothetical protein [Corynebacterium kalidii]MCJ7857834.1 hypothetical protein [Corynebacterium kalidii]
MTFRVPPVPTSAVYWTALDTTGPVGDDTLRSLVDGLSGTHGALRAILTTDGSDGSDGTDGTGCSVTVPDEAPVPATDVIAADGTGPGSLASSLDPATGRVWRVSRLSDTRLLLCVHRGVVDAASWATVVDDARSLLDGTPVEPSGDWGRRAATAPPAPFAGGGPSTYKTFDVSDPDALLRLLPAQLGVGHGEILVAAVLLARAAAGLPAAPVVLRARDAAPAQSPGDDRTVGRLDRDLPVPAPHVDLTDALLTGGPAVRKTLESVRDILRGGIETATEPAELAEPAEPTATGATVEVSPAKVSVSGPVRPVDGVPHVILGTHRLARVTVVDERGGAGGVLLWPHLEQTLVSLAALARLIDAGLPQSTPDATPDPVDARARNLFRGVAGTAGTPATPDVTVDLTQLPEVNGFAVAKRLQREHTGGSTLVRLPGVTDPKSTGGRAGRVGSGVTGRLITG